MSVIQTCASAEEANQLAASLVGHGIGAEVHTAEASESTLPFQVAVLADDALRARQVLGLVEPVEEEEEDLAELTRSTRSILLPVLLIGLAFVAVPLLAFFLAFKLSGG